MSARNTEFDEVDTVALLTKQPRYSPLSELLRSLRAESALTDAPRSKLYKI